MLSPPAWCRPQASLPQCIVYSPFQAPAPSIWPNPSLTMQQQQQQQPLFPPPPPPLPLPLPPSPHMCTDTSSGLSINGGQIDYALKEWNESMAAKYSDRIKPTTQTTMLPEIASMLKVMADSLAKLRVLHSKLCSQPEQSSDLWTEVAKIKATIDKCTERIHVPALKQKITRNKARRKRRKQAKQRKEQLRQSNDELCLKWFDKKQSEMIRKKLEQAVEREAGGSLGEVKKKIQEINGASALIEALKDLREHRKNSKKWKMDDGPNIIESNERFTDLYTKIQDTASIRLKLYEEEQHALEVMMSAEVDAKFTAVADTKDPPSSTLTMTGDPIKDYYFQSKKDTATFNNIRQEWDRYLSPQGYTVPNEWVEPATPSSERWAVYMAK